jgi:2',3'-cyclic-nucleotide 2'-phosphodiesterase
MGRVFMDPLDCPFRTADALIEPLLQKTKTILIDVHAEASSEKMAMGWHFDGRATLVVGTHTHVQTADERILPNGTAFLTDAGMTGPYDSVIGVKKEIIVEKFLTKRGRRFEPARGDPWLCGVIVESDDATGRALSIERVRIELNRPETHP